MQARLPAAELHSLVPVSTDSQGQLAIQLLLKQMPIVHLCLNLAQRLSARSAGAARHRTGRQSPGTLGQLRTPTCLPAPHTQHSPGVLTSQLAAEPAPVWHKDTGAACPAQATG